MTIVCFDLEGPLSPQDNAYEVMELVKDGFKVFEVISRYDDILAWEGREGYEAGDTLALILPFLARAGIKLDDIERMSRQAGLVPGAKQTVAQLRERGWDVFVVSTSYAPHALNIARQLSVSADRVYCTNLDRSLLEVALSRRETMLLDRIKQIMLEELYIEDLAQGTKDEEIKRHLDAFFWEALAETRFGIVTDRLAVRGGRRKAWALEEISRLKHVSLCDFAFVGDAITDVRACQLVEVMGGLAIAFNGNRFILPHATIGVASESLLDVASVIEVWAAGGRGQVKAWIKENAQAAREETYDWLVGVDEGKMQEIVRKHTAKRVLVRNRAAKLG